ncbi:hypothetical protein HPHPH43_1360 [Helicobacter pylori Hp H-43]|nr:hypothetical protein HPHPH43_1360 [Helicobacter pylori Hp H-43]
MQKILSRFIKNSLDNGFNFILIVTIVLGSVSPYKELYMRLAKNFKHSLLGQAV